MQENPPKDPSTQAEFDTEEKCDQVVKAAENNSRFQMSTSNSFISVPLKRVDVSKIEGLSKDNLNVFSAMSSDRINIPADRERSRSSRERDRGRSRGRDYIPDARERSRSSR